MLFRKYWKRLILALFACFWTGCESEAVALYGVAPCDENSPCGCGENGDGCFAPEYGVEIPDSSDFVVYQPDSSAVEPDSGNGYDEPVAVYGPPCYFDGSCGSENGSPESSGSQEQSESSSSDDDGPQPMYGVPSTFPQI